MSEREYGIVKFFSNEKGYGFITPEAGGKDIYVHRTGLSAGVDKDADDKLILLGDKRVAYTVADSDRKKGDGKMAVNVEYAVATVSTLVATV
jgi:CspA family cold shock protein